VRTRRQAGLILGRRGWLPDDLDEFVPIPPGTFRYGDNRDRREISYRFWMARYPVTNAQFARFIEADGYNRSELWSEQGWTWRTGDYDSTAPDWLRDWLEKRPPEKRDQPFWWNDPERANPIFPVVGVSWFEAQAYATWLRAWLLEQADVPAELKAMFMSGEVVTRLPTEEEWERGMRGREGREYPWGDEYDVRRANCADAWAGRELDVKAWREWYEGKGAEQAGSTAVATFPGGSTPDGLWDGAGNVWEWTASEWESGSESRVVRGGSWIGLRRGTRGACRGCVLPVYFHDVIGFRLVVAPALVE
jgi:formylglycine-generating enzyme required for sulfatase activity